MGIICSGGMEQRDVAFYFTHWLTDLAGAEPCPQEGCEKFVLKFPHNLLVSFLNSFSIVKELSVKTETEVFEEYLRWRWNTHDPPLGEVPHGRGSVAQMRLVVMGQGDSKRIIDCFNKMPAKQADVLQEEMARTGCVNQSYSCDYVKCLGPAFLIYYGPALMQKAGAIDPSGTLSILSNIYAQARDLFPLSEEQAGETVTVRIDAIKNLQVVDILKPHRPGEAWVVERTSATDSIVRLINRRRSVHTDWTNCRHLFMDLEDEDEERSIRASYQVCQ